MKSVLLIYRKAKPEFKSIENVFDTLLPFLNVRKIELPFLSRGFNFRKKNVEYVQALKSDLYHITGNDHYIVLGLKKRKTILTIHDIEIIKRNKGLKRYLLKKFWFDLPIRYATVVTTISEFSKKEILSLGNYQTSIKVIYNPLTLALEYTPKVFNDDQPNILHIGTKHNKNLEKLIDAISDINCHLTIVGKPNETQIKKLKEKQISYSIKSNLSNQEMIQEYINCDILSFISTYEGFGLPIIEAQACGRVVLTSKIASLPEVASKGAFFVNPFDIHDIRKGIIELINNNQLRESLITKGLENVKRFDPQFIAKQYSDLYNQILNEN